MTLSTKASWSWSLWTEFSCFIWDPFAASAPGFVCLSSVCLHLSITARSSHLWWTQKWEVIAHGAVFHADNGLMLSQTWTEPPMNSSKAASSYSFHPSIIFFFPLMGYFEASLTTCGLYTPCFYAVALTFPTWNIFRARSYSPPFPLCSQGVTPCWNIPMFRSK